MIWLKGSAAMASGGRSAKPQPSHKCIAKHIDHGDASKAVAMPGISGHKAAEPRIPLRHTEEAKGKLSAHIDVD